MNVFLTIILLLGAVGTLAHYTRPIDYYADLNRAIALTCDYNGDGEVTLGELRDGRRNWAIKHNMFIRANRMYHKSTGNRVTREEIKDEIQRK